MASPKSAHVLDHTTDKMHLTSRQPQDTFEANSYPRFQEVKINIEQLTQHQPKSIQLKPRFLHANSAQSQRILAILQAHPYVDSTQLTQQPSSSEQISQHCKDEFDVQESCNAHTPYPSHKLENALSISSLHERNTHMPDKDSSQDVVLNTLPSYQAALASVEACQPTAKLSNAQAMARSYQQGSAFTQNSKLQVKASPQATLTDFTPNQSRSFALEHQNLPQLKSLPEAYQQTLLAQDNFISIVCSAQLTEQILSVMLEKTFESLNAISNSITIIKHSSPACPSLLNLTHETLLALSQLLKTTNKIQENMQSLLQSLPQQSHSLLNCCKSELLNKVPQPKPQGTVATHTKRKTKA